MGYTYGVPQSLIKRINEIEIDTHYYDVDVIPSNQDLFTYEIDEENKTAIITGFADENHPDVVVVPYRIEQNHKSYTVNGFKEGAFVDDRLLQTITLPNTIHEIPNELFRGCEKLSQCNIPKSVSTIGNFVFLACSSLDLLFIGPTVKNIGESAFFGCDALDIVCYKGSKAEEYAKENNIPYSLISYTLDDEVTKDSPNLVTSGSIYDFVTKSGVAGASHYEGIKEHNESDIDVINRVLESLEKEAKQDDIFIVKSLIAGDKYSYTAYVYEVDHWMAMDGNYSAENVYFKDDLTFTYQFGKYIPQAGGTVTIPAASKNIKELLLSCYSEEQNPTIVKPNVESFVAAPNILVEAGTKYSSPTITLKMGAGSYSFGSIDNDGNKHTDSGTGIIFEKLTVTNNKTMDVFEATNANALHTSIPEASIPDKRATDTDISYTFNLVAIHGDSTRYPVTNLGNEYLVDGERQNIKGNTVTKSVTASIKSYRAIFSGGISKDSGDLISTDIRALANNGNYNATKTITIKAQDYSNLTAMIVAIPNNNKRSRITKVMKTDGLPVDVTSQWHKIDDFTVDVEGLNGYLAIPYDIYMYKPAVIDSTEIHEITLG